MTNNHERPIAESGQVFIPLCVPSLGGNEWKYVKECLDTNWVSTLGPFVERFERAVADYTGTEFGVATVNGTAALHVALRVAGVKPNDEVLVSTLTFIAPANAIRYVGAWPIFIDADPQFWQMDTGKVEEFLRGQCLRKNGKTINKESRRTVSAIVPVHILGHPVDMNPLMSLAREFGLVVVEDATEALGTCYNGRHAGAIGDIGCFSFNGNKIITTGGGGMIVTDREDWARECKYLTTQAKDDEIEYIHNDIGYNYRLTNLLAAVGVAQMELLDAYVDKKRAIAKRYDEAFEAVKGISGLDQAPWARSTFWMYTILVDAAEFGMNSRDLLRRLAATGIQGRPLWQPIHLSRAHAYRQHVSLPVAEALAGASLSLPCSVGLSQEEQGAVIAQIHQAVRQ